MAITLQPRSIIGEAEVARPLVRGSGPTTWTVAIDWDRDGKFTETYDDVTDRVVSAEWFLGARQPYQETADNSVLSLTLTNQDRRYSPEHKSSPLFGKLVPFRPVRIQSSDGLVTTTHWRGWVEGFQPFTNQFGQRYTQVVATGAMQLLKAAETSLPLQESKRTDEIIADLVEEVVPPPCIGLAWIVGRVGNSELGVNTLLAPPYTALDEGLLTVPLAGDNWVRQGGSSDAKQSTFNVYHAIRDVAAAERGRFFYDRDGKAIFWNRHRVFQGEVASALFDDTMTDMAYAYAGLEHLKNDIIVTCHPRDITTSDQEVLWELKGAVINVSTAEPRTLYVNYKDENDKRVGGKEVTVTDLKFQKGSAAVTVEEQANGAKLTFTTTGTSEAVITQCIVRGRKIVDSGTMDAKEVDSDSITEYGRRTLQLNLPLIDQLDLAENIAKLEKNRLGQPRGAISSLKLVSHGTQGGSQHLFQRGLSLGDKVIVAETQTDHEGAHYIVGESHKLTAGGTLFETTWYLEPAPASSPWKLGVEGRSELGKSAVLLAC
jgi:hypothetical protein